MRPADSGTPRCGQISRSAKIRFLDDVLSAMLAHPRVRAVRVSTMKPDVYPDCEGVGVEVFQIKDEA